MTAARYWPPFGFLALATLGPWLGGVWTLALLAALPLLLAGLDWLLGEEADAPPPPGSPYRLLPWLYVPLQLAALAWAGAMVAQPSTSLAEVVGLTLSTGVATGVFGFLAAHELVHSGRLSERILGLAMLAGVLDMQFAISHLHGHHRRAATFEDPATARRGEGLYAFAVRSLAGQASEAWSFETRRLRRAGRAPFGPANRLVRYGLVEAALVIGIGLISPRALGFFVAQSVLAVFLLEAFNYVAHYGLVRRPGPDGRPEPLTPRHSWNSARRMNNWTLFNMGRHADHHRFSARAYSDLEVLEGGARLPCGYAGVLMLSLVPPLFRKVMDPRVDAVMGDPVPGVHRSRAAAALGELDSRSAVPQVPA
jgi:alkane 1-monooxygenase